MVVSSMSSIEHRPQSEPDGVTRCLISCDESGVGGATDCGFGTLSRSKDLRAGTILGQRSALGEELRKGGQARVLAARDLSGQHPGAVVKVAGVGRWNLSDRDRQTKLTARRRREADELADELHRGWTRNCVVAVIDRHGGTFRAD